MSGEQRYIVLEDHQIVLTDETFLRGYNAGYHLYTTRYQGHALTDAAIAQFLLRNIGFAPDRYTAGFVIGWIQGLLKERNA